MPKKLGQSQSNIAETAPNEYTIGWSLCFKETPKRSLYWLSVLVLFVCVVSSVA